MAKPFAPKLKRPIKIAVINRKGGVGKTNTTINLACEFVNRGYSTVIADTEKEGGCVHWQSLAGDNAKVPVVGMYDPMIKVNIKAYEGSNDIILIDTAGIIVDMDDEEDGKASKINSAVMAMADYVIVPLQPAPADFRATEICVESLSKIQEFRDGAPFFRVLLTSTRANEDLTRMALELFGEDYPYPVFKTTIRRSEEFKKAHAYGQGIVDYAKRSESANDIRDLADEILKDLDEGKA
ncbi:hypothetical protein DXI23_20040 [Marinobacter flavimaris]|jgi:chromosome partitioning protein|uniref:CobQ/CobB/MinD/ParA nucleotide binding domain-containing protein n=3 Tax=Marinobacter TaxID=2742 RepID=A0A3D8GXD5_9GAMM|nr:MULTISPECIES: AAA family ATPase [Marinobacter]MBD3642273.1 AAA family ATPase [Marinobacter sp.]HBW82883.1 hypothetical protein [Gammaproteobacteria bacterium]MBQ93672.1 hypothetical protein [Marinobacter sp.]PHQ23664.1 hypothetical protein CLH62_20525 [Marinobacter guineae]PPI78499.1 hypothetical protein MDHKLMBL_19740 [Marinobacter flavimaris]|tara:strand:+ start:588 stop:1304 length:717 start_codon:yes stop_codon:yes gene_type:complete